MEDKYDLGIFIFRKDFRIEDNRGLNKLNQILSSNYTIISEPEINIQVNIDGIILDTFERDMFGNNKHEYLIERFKIYSRCRNQWKRVHITPTRFCFTRSRI